MQNSAPQERRKLPLVPFAYGFRPFFLAALLYAPLAIVVWLAVRTSGSTPLTDFPPQVWHGHEMIFGFAGAAIAGFLLTAVPSWTGAKGFAGTPLIALAALWVAGRLAFAVASHIPLSLLIAVELLFVPALVALIAPPLLRARNRNTPLLIVLAAYWCADAIFLYALLHADVGLATTLLRTAINVVLLLITVIGGRIVPAFTANALKRRGLDAQTRSLAWLEIAVIVLMALIVVTDVVTPLHPLAGALAAVAAAAQALRLVLWKGLRTLQEPIVWVLHLAYAWLPVGLALKAGHLLTGTAWTAQWLHALTMGAIGMMIVAVITRASLGHTGRPLAVSPVTAAGYLMLAAAVLVRVLGGSTIHYEMTLRVSGGLWVLAFALILAVYAPILLRPRIDGRAG